MKNRPGIGHRMVVSSGERVSARERARRDRAWQAFRAMRRAMYPNAEKGGRPQ